MEGVDNFSDLFQIGSEVSIDVNRIKDRIPEELFKKLQKDSSGVIIDYKITDGTDIGFFIKLDDESTHWFFNKELREYACKIKAIKTNKNTNIKPNRIISYQYTEHSKELAYILNPLNFAKWLIYSSKDIF